MVTSKEEFKLTRGIDGSMTLLFESKRPTECCEYVISQGIKIVSLYPEIYLANDLEPILPLATYLEGVLLDENVKYDGLELFTNLTFLSVPDNRKNDVDLSAFPKLETLNCNFSQRLQGLEYCDKLKSLTLGNYNAKTDGLSGLPHLNKLEDLNLIKTGIKSLQGIERFGNLNKLQIYSAPKLETIAALRAVSNSLEEIEVEKCKKITDYEILGKMKSLKRIIISASGEIRSLAFVRELPKLEFISFWGTSVLDGNLEYCEDIPYVGFDDKKHYTHKSDHFKKIVA